MPTERITFPGQDGTELAARLDRPEGPHLGTALFAHCFTCGKDIPAARRIAARLAALGLAVLRFDFTGLGACTSMTIRIFARRKGWPLTGVLVDVTHEKVHAQDAETPGKLDGFHRVIALDGDLDSEKRQKLLEIADKCPVHRTLEARATITTALADG